MSLCSAVIIMALAALSAPPQKLGEAKRLTAPETFTANAHVVVGGTGGGAALVTIQVDRYSADADRDGVAQALKQSGYPAFLEALRMAPTVGSVTISGQTFNIRWARQERLENGRNITLVTDKPIFFVGGGNPDAKPRAGYDVAILQFRMDDAGIGYSGTMAAAAKVKAGGPAGVEVDDYGEKPIELRGLTRAIK